MPVPSKVEGVRIVCFGELLLRLAAPGRELLLQERRLDVHVGGAEANVAVALARLGHDVAMVSRVPDNALGDAAAGHLRRYGVDASAVTTGPGRMGLYFLSPGRGPARLGNRLRPRGEQLRVGRRRRFRLGRAARRRRPAPPVGRHPGARGSAPPMPRWRRRRRRGRQGCADLVRRQLPRPALAALGLRSRGDPDPAGREGRHPVRQSSRHLAAARPRLRRRAARRGGGRRRRRRSTPFRGCG